MSKTNKKRLVLLCTGVAMLIVSIVFSCILANPGKDYTKEYEIHLALSEIDNIQDVETYLTDNNISYSIKNSTLTLNDYDNIKYVIRTDNSTGYLVPSEKFIRLAKLDAKDYEIVTVNKVLADDGWNELVSIKEKGITYSKYNGEYFIQSTWLLQAIHFVANFSFICITVYLVLDYLDAYFKFKAKNNKAKSKQSSQNRNIGNDIENF